MEAQSISSILNPAQTEETRKTNGELGKEDFLKMLTAQLKYQNPLDPMNDQEFVAQMTQFSSLEQLQNMNSALLQNVQWNMLLSQTINNTMATSLIGKTVVAESSVVAISDGSATPITFTSSEFAPSGTITICNAEGKVVRTLPVANLAAGENSVAWNGKDSEGNELPDGSYTFVVDLKNAEGQSVSVSSYRTGVVEGIKYVDGQAMLLVGGTLIPLSQVREVKPVKT